MNMESLDDDTFEEFKGGTLEIKQDTSTIRFNSDNSPDIIGSTSETRDNEMNTNLDNKSTRLWSGSTIIEIPKRITETLWSCRNNNNNMNDSTSGVTSVAYLSGTATLSDDNARDYFTFRDGIVEKAVQDCAESLVDPEIDGELINTFLLTEITMWDAEKERLVILTRKSVITVKYDFIALKMLEHRRVELHKLDSIVIGDLVYPPASLVPRLNGLASGVTNVMKGCLLERWSQQQKEQNSDPLNQQQRLFHTTTSLFQPRDRKTHGVRLLWNGGAPIGFTQRWNPFNNEVPYITFVSHPLQKHAESLNDNQLATFSVDEFTRQLIDVVERLEESTETNSLETNCIIHHKEIVLQTYVGLGSLIYNRNALGFFKVRGKFSF